MTVTTEISDEDHAVELIVRDASASSPDGSAEDGAGGGSSSGSGSEEMTSLLNPSEKPKINIFSVAYSRRKPREQVARLPDTETSPIIQFIIWIWGGSRYSGILCMALSSMIYFAMEVLSDSFSAQSIPLFETAFTRCTIVLILSYAWLRRSGQPLFGAASARKLLFWRALTGYLSLLSFIYCIQRLPLSQAIVLNFTTPVMASIVARIMLHEKLKIADIGGLACSFFGVIFIYRQILRTQGGWTRGGETNNTTAKGSQHIYAVLVGLFSAITGGISFCLIKAGAKASDQPVVTVFSFGLLSSPAAGICTFAFEEFVLPDFYSFTLMLILGVLAFFVEVFLARGFQLEKTSRAANVQYIEVAVSQFWLMVSSRISSSFGGIVGCLLILISVCCTIYFGPDKEME
ncbi:uncharacterized protein LOC110628714 isoform X1 [Manihot esculenta]|uniref:EamA domain-containing protein n=1 Tax=Manihot esculenta TaxID=3983 RepID=A0A2C9UVE8_MANES|nr:uncharacterized protein LOC110628714 isoform X1 [Manihot esculenta]OAY35075.1 hypothetical protein MANES_12G070200v8 [Manihot esculenta]